MTPSSTTGHSWAGQFSDGKSARAWPCRVRLGERGVLIDRGEGQEDLVWPYGALKTPHPLSKGEDEALVTYDHMPGAQLYVVDTGFVQALSGMAPKLTTSAHRWRWARPLVAAALLILAGFASVWLFDLRPARTVAGMLPDEARQTVGRNVISGFTSNRKVCGSPEGRAALDKLMTRLLAGVEKPKYFNLTVVDWGLVNAFAAPGGQMILTKGLIRAARTPEEVAGVLAHEIGHGIELHPETGLVRAVGLTTLVELLSGGSSGTLSNVGAMLLQNSYIRKDESTADRQALRLLKQASISQQGLADFFARIGSKGSSKKTDKKADDKARSRSFGAFDLLRTHPFPEERAAAVRRSPGYDVTPAMTQHEWRALKKICAS